MGAQASDRAEDECKAFPGKVSAHGSGITLMFDENEARVSVPVRISPAWRGTCDSGCTRTQPEYIQGSFRGSSCRRPQTVHHRSESHQLGVISRPLKGTNLPIRQWDLTVLINKGYIVEENCGGDTSNILTHESFLLQRSVRNAHRFIAELTCSGAGKQSAHKVVGQSRQRKRSPLDPAALLPHLVQ